MNNGEFIAEVIRRGSAAARRDYAKPRDRLKLEGALEGFEACRGKTNEELAELLREASHRTARAGMERRTDYWRHRCYEAEIEWVCNVLSAALVSNGFAPIVTPTTRGMLAAAEILGVHE